MASGPYAAAVVNGNVRMGGLLDGFAEKGAYGDMSNILPGDAYLLVEERISGELLDNLLYFRVAGNSFVQSNGLRGLGKDGGGFFRGKGDFRNACMAQPGPVWLSNVPVLRWPCGSIT